MIDAGTQRELVNYLADKNVEMAKKVAGHFDRALDLSLCNPFTCANDRKVSFDSQKACCIGGGIETQSGDLCCSLEKLKIGPARKSEPAYKQELDKEITYAYVGERSDGPLFSAIGDPPFYQQYPSTTTEHRTNTNLFYLEIQ